MSGFDVFEEMKRITAAHCEVNGLPVPRYTNRLAGLEDTIAIAAPDYCEAAESILSPMMAALEKRYEFGEHRQEWADVEHAAEKLFKALMAADEAEES